jgi:hypothetical protein
MDDLPTGVRRELYEAMVKKELAPIDLQNDGTCLDIQDTTHVDT